MTQPQPPRPGEVLLDLDPATVEGPTLAFIGRIGSPWTKGNSPKNLREARAAGGSFTVQIDLPYRAGLLGLSVGDAIVVLYWMDAARRDLIVQSPAHRDGPTGTFALRSPARPNPIALAVTRLLAIQADSGTLTIDAIDAFDGTPVLDIKPWLASVDIPPGFQA
ncbi:SAM-dependent methyltransferase [Yoonia sp.]|uniref:SAM-dependent methyltransferase n=1 Tax=Yoonia sp. TaxID=2212373 RepID=UPI002FDAA7DD